MNNLNLKLKSALLLLVFILVGYNADAQYLQPTSGTESYDLVCGTVEDYYDDGGVDGNYSSSTNSTIVFCAPDPTCYVTVEFTLFDLEASSVSSCYETLTVQGDVNGNDGSYGGDANDGGASLPCNDGTNPDGSVNLPVFEGAPGGCLSFEFNSDSSLSQDGWEAVVTAVGDDNEEPTDGACELVCSPDRTFNLGPGECSIPFPDIVTTSGDCSPAVPTPMTIEGITGEFDFSTYTQYDEDVNGYLAGDYPKTFNTGPSIFNVPTEATLIADPNSGFAFGPFSMVVPFDGTLTFDYEINGYYGELHYVIGDPATATTTYIDNMIATTPQSGSFTIELEAGDIFSIAPAILFFGYESEVTITNLLFEENIDLTPTPYSIEVIDATLDGEPVDVSMEDNLLIGAYELTFGLFNPQGEQTDECSVGVEIIESSVNGGSLSCNDNVNVSADELCSVYMDPDMFLEGSNYGCYDDLEINIWVNNNPSNVIANVTGTTLDFSALLGTHTFEIYNPETGNKCWGNFIIEDKQAPTPECPCSTLPEESLTISGELTVDSPTFARWAGTYNQPVTNCALAGVNTYRYDVVPFQVSASGFYQLDAVWVGDSHGAIFEGSFDPNDACANMVESNDDGAGGLDPSITVELSTGVTYYYVLTTWSSANTQEGEWTVTIDPSSAGAFLEGDANCIFKCTDIDLIRNSTDLTPNPNFAEMDNCTPVEYSFSDHLTTSDCGVSTITRSWIFTDAAGNSATCEQFFTFNSISMGEVQDPVTPVLLDCGADVTPEGIYAALGAEYAYPYVVSQDAQGNPINSPVTGQTCSIYTTYSDQDLKACGEGCYGNRKVIRTWTIFDWCEQDTRTFVQVIKSADTEGPTFIVKDTTVSTRAWDCLADFTLPAVWELHDNCDDSPDYEVVGEPGMQITRHTDNNGNLVKYTVTGASKGIHAFKYIASDCCGNTTTMDIAVIVKDQVGPVVTTKRDVVVSLTPEGNPDGEGYDGSAKLNPGHLDNGSYDMCTDVWMEIRRVEPPVCSNIGLNGHNNNATFRAPAGNFPPYSNGQEYSNRDTDGGQFVKFCCEDLTAVKVDANGDGVIDDLDMGYVEVHLRVWDDGDMDGVFGTAGDNYNDSWSFVKVEDKLPPILNCPQDATIYCDWPIELSTDYGSGFQPIEGVNFEKTGKAIAYGVCGELEVTFSDRDQRNDCGYGTIIRTWQATSGTGKVSTCRQNITVEERETDNNFEVAPPIRTEYPDWASCSFSIEDLENVSSQYKPSVTSGPCDVIGENIKVDTFLFEDGVCKKWAVTYNYYNWCTDEEAGPFTVYYFYRDTGKPVLENCEDKMYGVDANCEHELTVSNVAIDDSGCSANGWLKWQVFIDLWGDGTVDYYGSSYRSENNWTAKAGSDASLPEGHTYAPLVYVKGIGVTASGEQIIVTIDNQKIEGQMSNHKVKWKVADGCHNFATCNYNIMVADKKPPTPYCVDVSTALMQGGMVELWAVDMDRGAFDNCTPQDWLLFSFDEAMPVIKDTIITIQGAPRLVNKTVPHFFDENGFVSIDGDGVARADVGDGQAYPKASQSVLDSYFAGQIQRWRPEDRTSGKVYREQGQAVPAKISVWDEKCNTDFCIVYLRIIDNQGEGTVAGIVTTEDGGAVPQVETTLYSDSPEYPLTVFTGENGYYSFSDNPLGFDYEIVPSKTEEFKNGVSTIDLVMIQQHILGANVFDSPYKVIAADINGNERVQPTDLLILRKLILGIIQTVEGNESWKFVDADYEFADPLDPWPYPSTIIVDELQSASHNNDFIAVKVGDLNGSVKLRSDVPFTYEVQDQMVSAGEIVEMDMRSSDVNELFGTQYTLKLKGLSYEGVKAGSVEVDDSNVGVINSDLLSFSASMPYGVTKSNDEVLWTFVFKAERDGKLSDMIEMNSRLAEAESYTGESLTIRNTKMSFAGAEHAEAAFTLYQNEPNPFTTNTLIAFDLQESAQVTISISDVNGRVVYEQTVNGVRGYNELRITQDDIAVSGVLYYTVMSGDYTATKKMVSIK